nr:16S rRNA (guanine(527)-N(7))-methyltransferase RsmG [Desulfurispira natronophila]
MPAFERYAQELERWNRAKKITAITGRQEIFQRHFLDSVQGVVDLVPRGAVVMDIGCGAGFPGVPLRMVRPDIQLIAVDSISKKMAFVRHLVRQLGLAGVVLHDCRAEELSQYHGEMDVVMFRAVAEARELVKIGLPFLKQTGKLLLWKTRREVLELEVLASSLGLQVSLTFPPDPEGRDVVLVSLQPTE